MSDENNNNIPEDESEYATEEIIENPFKRVALLLFSPRLVFESLKMKSDHRDWIFPLVLVAIISLLVINAGYDYLKNDQIAAIESRIEKNTRLSDEQKAEQLQNITEGFEKAAGIQRLIISIISVASPFVSTLIIALMVWVAAHHFQKGTIEFGDTYKICALSLLVSVPSTIVKFPLIIYHESFAEAKTSLGLLLPESMGEGFLFNFLNGIDIFTIWIIILIGVGIAALTRFSFKKSVVPVFGMYFVFKLLSIIISSSLQSIGQ